MLTMSGLVWLDQLIGWCTGFIDSIQTLTIIFFEDFNLRRTSNVLYLGSFHILHSREWNRATLLCSKCVQGEQVQSVVDHTAPRGTVLWNVLGLIKHIYSVLIASALADAFTANNDRRESVFIHKCWQLCFYLTSFFGFICCFMCF